MHIFVVRRRGIAASANQLDAALTRLRDFEDRASRAARWLHSYALREVDRRFGLVCVFEADSAQAVGEHAVATHLPAEEILPVTGLLIERGFAPTQTYLIRRRQGWRDAAHFEREAAAARSACDSGQTQRVAWLRSYAVREDDGRAGSLCLFQAVGPQALLEHATRAGWPVTEITPVLGRVVFRERAPAPVSTPTPSRRRQPHHPTGNRP